MLNNTTEKPDDFVTTQRLLESANDSARHFRNVYVGYLTVMIYTLVVIVATDQELLFKAGDKQLPLVNITVPIKAFFICMPWALLVVHFYLLIQASFLAGKVRDYVAEIKGLESQERNKAYRLLSPVPLAHTFVAGKPRWILSLIIYISLLIFPLATLLAAQIIFLPYQSEWITWQHRIIIIIDLALLWGFWYYIYILKNRNLGIENLFEQFRSFVRNRSMVNIIVVLPLQAVGFVSKWLVYFSWVFLWVFVLPLLTILLIYVSDIPSKDQTWLQRLITEIVPNHQEIQEAIQEAITKRIPNHFDLENLTLVKREPPPERLAAYYIKDNKIVTKQNESEWCELAEPLKLSNRNLRRAELSNTKICNADLTDVDLWKADLSGADLWEANLRDADLTDANFTDANLTKADIWEADLTDAVLIEANFTEADLRNADLTRADLTQADLTDANLTDADLTDANLRDADLTQADLTDANLTDANLTDANLRDADLTDANLTDANLTKANLAKVDLTDANLTNADLTDTNLTEATLTKSILKKTDLTTADLTAADLTAADLTEATLTKSVLWGADLREANLRGADLFGINLSETNFTSATMINTKINYSWIWKDPYTENIEFLPVGIPEDWKNTLKPDYLCPWRFDIGDYIDFSKYADIKQQLRDKERRLINIKQRLISYTLLPRSESQSVLSELLLPTFPGLRLQLVLSELELLQHALENLKSELRTEVAEVIIENCKPYED